MKKFFILTAIAGFGFFTSYSQAESAKRFVPETGTKKVEEVKVKKSLDEEKAAKAKQSKAKKVSQVNNDEQEKMKLEADKKAERKSNSAAPASAITPVKKN